MTVLNPEDGKLVVAALERETKRLRASLDEWRRHKNGTRNDAIRAMAAEGALATEARINELDQLVARIKKGA
jgi:hypothetical protein